MKVLLSTAMALGFVLALGTTLDSGASAAAQSDQGQTLLVRYWHGDGWYYGPGPYYYDRYYYDRPLLKFGPLELL